MSYAGHVFDMIRRYKENRQIIGRHRDDAKERIKKSHERNSPPRKWDLNVENLGKIRKETEAKKQKEQSYYGWIIIMVFGVGVIIYFILVLRGSF